MCQRISQIICINFLLTLLFSLVAMTTPRRFSMNDCHDFITNTECQCLLTSNRYKIQCPGMVQNPKVRLEVTRNSSPDVILKCNHLDGELYLQLPVMNIGDIDGLTIEDCPLPSKPLTDLLTYLGIQKLKCLTFQYNHFMSNITRKHLSGLNISKLVLNDFDLSLIQDNLFMDLQSLEYLTISSFKISLTQNIFTALVNLKWLKMEVKNLQQSSLPEGIFRNQSNLVSLDLSYIPIRYISKNFFEGIRSLIILFLNFNGIESFQPDAFSLLKNVTLINLSHNNFHYLPSELFDHNKRLSKVDMINSSSLKALPSGLFANLPKLHSAYISCGTDEIFLSGIELIHCDLDEIPQDLFNNSNNIKKISLAKNKLLTVTGTLFKHQPLLEYLDLSYNRLKSLSKELFKYTNQLTVLKLSHNYLTGIANDLFANLNELEELHLDNNHITTIDSDAFKYNNNLHSMYMENNRINKTDAFKCLKKLEILNLRKNTLCHIFKGYGMYALKKLDLSQNSIASLNYDDFLPYSFNRLSINLNFNMISRINMTSKWSSIFNEKAFLSVQLNHNPINCDCKLLAFLQYISGVPHEHLQFEISELVCDEPDNMKNLNISYVDLKALLCYFDFKKFELPHCPLGCKCWERIYDSVLLVNCTSNNLAKMPALPSVQPLGLKSIELHVENNKLKDLPIVSTPGYEDVTRIYAAANKFSDINVRHLPEHLIYLDLSRNNFKGLNEDVLKLFKRNSLLKIALSGNPWNCGCENKPLRQFVWQSSNMITDINKMYCASPTNSNMIEYFNTYDNCQDGLISLLIWVVSISIVCFSIAITGALYYKYQTEIKIWMYKHNFCSCWVNEEELDKDKTYDAFVSYSSIDEEFVIGQLLPKLENGPIRFKLCVHARDFIIGDIIPDQIIRAIADSRRTIVVLSENFIQSVWARMEFRLAHQAGLDEKRSKVIVIVYGEIGNISSLDLELQAYLKITTYLEWGNPWFWDRLRYIMPHPIRRNDVNELQLDEFSTAQNAREANR